MLSTELRQVYPDDGDALLRAYVTSAQPQEQEMVSNEQETETFIETFSGESSNFAASLAFPDGL
jgi:hypothetical protein